MPHGGRPGQLSPKAVLLGMLCAIDSGRPAQLTAGREALASLPVGDQLRLGVARHRDGEIASATYRQFSQTHQVMTRAIDATPVPSFRGAPDGGRKEHLDAHRAGVDTEGAMARLLQVTDALVEASVPDRYRNASSSLAVDWTDHETWSRPRAKGDPEPANDPDASWGHAKGNAPGASEHLFFGYYAQVATMINDERGQSVPELVRRVGFGAPSVDPVSIMTAVLLRAYGTGVPVGDVLCDCGYSNREATTFAVPLRRAGAALVMDLHSADRASRGTTGGAIVAAGNVCCPCTPKALLSLGTLPRGATEEEATAHDAQATELARYKLGRVSADDDEGTHRVMCPAVLGKLRCPLRSDSMALSLQFPEILTPPEHPPSCCTQKTITVNGHVLAKTAQKHDLSSKAHRISYRRRTASERTFSWFQSPSTIGIRRGWSRLFGATKNHLMYVLGAIVHNVRIVESFERRLAEDARRTAVGLPPRQRRRRRWRRLDEVQSSEPEPPSPPTPPD